MEIRELENELVSRVSTWGEATIDDDALSDYEVASGN